MLSNRCDIFLCILDSDLEVVVCDGAIVILYCETEDVHTSLKIGDPDRGGMRACQRCPLTVCFRPLIGYDSSIFIGCIRMDRHGVAREGEDPVGASAGAGRFIRFMR